MFVWVCVHEHVCGGMHVCVPTMHTSTHVNADEGIRGNNLSRIINFNYYHITVFLYSKVRSMHLHSLRGTNKQNRDKVVKNYTAKYEINDNNEIHHVQTHKYDDNFLRRYKYTFWRTY